VDGLYDRAFKRPLVTQPALAIIGRRAAQQPVNRGANSLAHFIRRTIRESDRDYVIDRDVLSAEDFQVAFDQHSRLARSGSGSNRKVAIECVRGDSLFGFEFVNCGDRSFHVLPADEALILVVRPNPKPIQNTFMFTSQRTPTAGHANCLVFTFLLKAQ
jgi:hypothetical protein